MLAFLCFQPWMSCDQRHHIPATLALPATVTSPSKQTVPSLSCMLRYFPTVTQKVTYTVLKYTKPDS